MPCRLRRGFSFLKVCVFPSSSLSTRFETRVSREVCIDWAGVGVLNVYGKRGFCREVNGASRAHGARHPNNSNSYVSASRSPTPASLVQPDKIFNTVQSGSGHTGSSSRYCVKWNLCCAVCAILLLWEILRTFCTRHRSER